MKIGFLDSGIGGLTVLSEALKNIPNHEYLYYADTMRAPYGEKPKEVVRQYVFDAVEFLINQGAGIIVIACNTATSVAAAELRHHYQIPIIGMEPAVKPALELSQKGSKRVLVTATPLTLIEEKMQILLEKYDHHQSVDLCPLPELVKLAERFDFSDESVLFYLKDAFSKYNLNEYGSIVLGCTHFPLFKKQIKRLFPTDVVIIDGSEGTVNHLKDVIGNRFETPQSQVTFYCSGNIVKDESGLEPFQQILRHLSTI